MSFDSIFGDDWKVLTASEYCVVVTDGTHDSPKKTEMGKLLVTSKNVIGGSLDLSKSYFISEADFHEINKRSKVDKNDVLLSMIGTVGEPCLITEKPDFAIKNVGLLKNDDSIKAKWLYFYLSSPYGQTLIKERTRGSTQQYIPLGEIRNLPIHFPSNFEKMKSIVDQLSTLQDKIHLNQQTNETLESMAQAIFKSWFVDFDPVRAKIKTIADGRNANRAAMAVIAGVDLEQDWDVIDVALEQKLSRMKEDQRQQLQRTAELFPDELVDSELGEVPKGWGVKTLEDYITLSYGKSLRKKDREEGNVPVYGSGGLTGVHNKILVEGPGIIVGRKGTVGSIFWEDKGFWPIDTVFYVEPKNEVDLSFYYYLLDTLRLNEMNTDAAVPGLNRNNAYRLQVPEFPKKLMKMFTDFTVDIHKIVGDKKEEKKTLENLRDALLPKLISGKVL